MRAVTLGVLHPAGDVETVAGLQMSGLGADGQLHLTSHDQGMRVSGVRVRQRHGAGRPIAHRHSIKSLGGGLWFEVLPAL